MPVISEPATGTSARTLFTAELKGGRRIDIRPVQPDDVECLVDLYDQLDLDDRVDRFRSAYRPPPAFFAELANPVDGARLVAELQTPVCRRLVGEAGYVELPNGNGEVSMLVARRWRGWLGPVLFAALRRLAAKRGIPSLEAEVPRRNSPMRAVLHAAGAAVIGRDRWLVERLVVGTSGEVPTWAGCGDGPRVLIEAPAARLDIEDDIRTAGFAVVSCHGPRRRTSCPATAGSPCPLAAGADVVVVCPPSGDVEWDRLVDGHRLVHPDVPVIVADTREGGQSVADLVRAIARRDAGVDQRDRTFGPGVAAP